MPSATLIVVQPAPARAWAAYAERAPDRQITYTLRSCGISPARAAIAPTGMCTASGACPAAHSSSSRTSSRYTPAGRSVDMTEGLASSDWNMVVLLAAQVSGNLGDGAPVPPAATRSVRDSVPPGDAPDEPDRT